MKLNLSLAKLAFAVLGGLSASARADDALRPDQVAFRGLYKELIETNTTLSSGSCTEAAKKMAARLSAAGYGAADLHLFATAEHPKEGGLVAVLAGSLLAAVLAAILLRLRNRHYRSVWAMETRDRDHDGVPDLYDSQQD